MFFSAEKWGATPSRRFDDAKPPRLGKAHRACPLGKQVLLPPTQLPHRAVQPLKREGEHAVGEDLLDDL